MRIYVEIGMKYIFVDDLYFIFSLSRYYDYETLFVEVGIYIYD